MRHIPEDELHAYLDQGLSRSQCVEIESHLADCPSCQATRDGIAALRDRTTALLARLAPPRNISPSFESLRHRADVVVSARRRRLNIMAWAASLVVAVGLGYSASLLLRPTGAASVATRAPVMAAPAAPAPAAFCGPTRRLHSRAGGGRHLPLGPPRRLRAADAGEESSGRDWRHFRPHSGSRGGARGAQSGSRGPAHQAGVVARAG